MARKERQSCGRCKPGRPCHASDRYYLVLFWFVLFDQHHRDPVDDRIKHLAVGASELVRLLELDPGVTLGACEYLEQLIRNHPRILVRTGTRRRASSTWSTGAAGSDTSHDDVGGV